jgi:dTMP kinase
LSTSKGLFVTLEGVEGSGKTSHAAELTQRLRAQGRAVMLTHEPGDTRAGQAIRAIFLDPAVSLQVGAELLLVLADRAQHVAEKLKPALARGEIVISDRYADSTAAYQGYGRGFDLKLLSELNRLASNDLIPDLTVLLDCSVETGLARTRVRTSADNRGPDRFEGADLEFHHRVREGFLTLARNEPKRVHLVNSERAREEVFADIIRLVDEVIGLRCR